MNDHPILDEWDRRLIVATQGGLPLVAQPYHTIAVEIGLPVQDVMARLRMMAEAGIIRRIGAVPNHYVLGYRANGMSVWDIADDEVQTIGRRLGAVDFVSHCYRRPRRLPLWPYNLFAMVHGRTRPEVMEKVDALAQLIGKASRSHDVLFSTGILKKTGLRLAA